MSMRDDSFQSFLQGEDRLAALLRALPAYAPPASLERTFLAAVRAAQREVEQGRPAAAPAATDFGFAPPPSLEANFRKLAASVDAAQATRREALLGEIAQGKSPAEALGVDVRAETAAWLARRAQEQAASPPASNPPPRRSWAFLHWKGLGLAASAAMVAAVATQVLLPQGDPNTELAMREAFEAARLPAESVPQVAIAPAAPANAKPAAPGLHAQAQAEAAKRSAERSTAAAPSEALREELAARELANEAALDAKRAAAEPKPAPRPEPGLTKALPAEPRQDAFSGPPASQPATPPRQTTPAGKQESELARSTADAAPPAVAAAPAAPAPLERRNAVAAAPVPAPAPAPALSERARDSYAVASAPKPVEPPAPARAPAPAKIAAPVTESLRVTLADDPVVIAARLPAREKGLTWALYAAQPDLPALRAWAERLRAQPALQGSAVLLILRDPDLPPDALRIVVPPNLPATEAASTPVAPSAPVE